MLANKFCWKATVSCPAGLSYLCAFWATGVPCQERVLSTASACFTFPVSLRLLFVENGWQKDSYSIWHTMLFILVHHTDSHLSWAYINNYTAPVSLITAVSAQRYVFCCCQQMGDRNDLKWSLQYQALIKLTGRSILHMLKDLFDSTLKLWGPQVGLNPQIRNSQECGV